MGGAEFLDKLAAQGRYSFTIEEAVKILGSSLVAARAVLRRLKTKGLLASPFRGFHVIVPPEYRSLGCLPADQFIPNLMEYLGSPYYVGLLSAAELHGAAHQRPQEFQVVTDKNRPDIRCGAVHVVFVARRNVRDVPTQNRNTPRGRIAISAPEATALDLVSYPRHAGGLDNTLAVLADLAEGFDPRALAKLSDRMVEIAVAQRLGYLLERAGRKKAAAELARMIDDRRPHTVRLVPSKPIGHAPLIPRWNILVNAEVELEA